MTHTIHVHRDRAQRETALGRSRTVHSSASIALGRPIPAVNKKPAAKCEMQTKVQQLLIARSDNRWFLDFSLPHLHSTPALWGFRSEYRHAVWYRKTHNGVATRRWKNFEGIFICFDIMYERDGQTHRRHRPRLCIASTGNNDQILIRLSFSTLASDHNCCKSSRQSSHRRRRSLL